MLHRYVALSVFLFSTALHAQDYVQLRNAEVQQMVFFGETVAYRDWDATRTFEDPMIRDSQRLLVDKNRPAGYKADRLHQAVEPKALP